MSASIDDYKVDYFLPVTTATLGDRLAAEGFSYAGDHRGVAAYWTDGPVFFTVGYLPETSPTYALDVAVGISEHVPREPDTPINSIPAWRLLPSELQRTVLWEFDGPDSLAAQLARVWTDVVQPYVAPVWSDEAELARLIAEQGERIADEDRRFMDERLLRFARQQFQVGRYADAVSAYDELPVDLLTPADDKRVQIARKRM